MNRTEMIDASTPDNGAIRPLAPKTNKKWLGLARRPLPTNAADGRLITYRELADVLNVKRGTLARWHHDGMPARQFQERVRFSLPDVCAWIEARRSSSNRRRRIRESTFDRKGTVYFGTDGVRFKIGWSSDPRRQTCRIGNAMTRPIDLSGTAALVAGLALVAKYGRGTSSPAAPSPGKDPETSRLEPDERSKLEAERDELRKFRRTTKTSRRAEKR